MNQVISRLLSGLATGAIVGTAVLVPVTVSAQNANTVKVTAESQLKSESNKWSANNSAKPGDTVKYIISYQNTGPSEQRQVTVSSALPANAQLVADTTKIYNTRTPQGKPADNNNVSGQGVVIGDYAPGANAYVIFEVTLPAADKLACGNNELRNVGTVRIQGLSDSQATAITNVRRDCPQPAPATQTPPAPTQETKPQATPPAAAPATPATPAAPAAPATPAAPQPTSGKGEELPATGAGSAVALFAAATAAGYALHQVVLRRKSA